MIYNTHGHIYGSFMHLKSMINMNQFLLALYLAQLTFINVFRYLLYVKENSFFMLPTSTLFIKAIFKLQEEEEEEGWFFFCTSEIWIEPPHKLAFLWRKDVPSELFEEHLRYWGAFPAGNRVLWSNPKRSGVSQLGNGSARLLGHLKLCFLLSLPCVPACAVMRFLVSDRKNEIADTADPKFMSLLCVLLVAVKEI